MSYTMDCASGASPERLARIQADPGTLLGDAVNLPFPDICDAWPHEDLGETFRAPLRSQAHVLCISGTLDVRTPPENAEEVLTTLANGRHLLIEGAGHDDDLLLSSPGIRDAMLAFLRGGPTVDRIQLPAIRFDVAR
jgi:pimeloyl-ACP methyl ester carboxylesterase